MTRQLRCGDVGMDRDFEGGERRNRRGSRMAVNCKAEVEIVP